MSITLMRYKDGKPVPIKMSVWDAFKGVPSPKPRPHMCDCCRTFHRPGAKSVAQSKAPTDAKVDKSLKNKDNGTTTEDPHAFTKGEDEKILKLKAANKTWKEIADEVGNGRDKGHVKYRFQQLKSAADSTKDGDKDKAKGDKKGDNEKTTEPQSLTKKEKKAQAAKAKQEENQKKKDNTGQKVEEAKKGGTASVTQLVKPDPTSGEKQKWAKAASKHFDRTGQRITAEQARTMAEDAA